jgi:hypothetical protein
MALTRVIALERGHDGRIVREAGEQFDVDLADERYKGTTWFVPANKAPVVKVKADSKARPPGAGPLPGSAVGSDKTPPAADGKAPDAASMV